MKIRSLDWTLLRRIKNMNSITNSTFLLCINLIILYIYSVKCRQINYISDCHIADLITDLLLRI